MIPQKTFLAALNHHRRDAVVLTTMGARGDWAALSEHPKRDLPVSGAMGKASSVALGVALAQPKHKIFLIDGDGSLLMNLGNLITIAHKAPTNLYHFVIDNGVYGTTGGQPLPGVGRYSLMNLAKASGYPSCHEFDQLSDFESNIGAILQEQGPAFICAKVEYIHDPNAVGNLLPPGVSPTREAWKIVRDELGNDLAIDGTSG